MSAALSKSCTTPPAPSRPTLHTIREPTLWLPGAALDDVTKTVVSHCTWLWGPRVRGSLSRRRRLQTDKPSGQQLPRSATHHRTRLAAPANPWLTPSFTSQLSHKGKELLATEPHRYVKPASRGGVLLLLLNGNIVLTE